MENLPGNGRKFLREPKKSLVTSEIESANEAKDSTVLYQKVNGEIRQAFGTLRDEVINTIVKETGRKPNDNMFIYFDTEKQEFRSFKKFNLIKIG